MRKPFTLVVLHTDKVFQIDLKTSAEAKCSCQSEAFVNYYVMEYSLFFTVVLDDRNLGHAKRFNSFHLFINVIAFTTCNWLFITNAISLYLTITPL